MCCFDKQQSPRTHLLTPPTTPHHTHFTFTSHALLLLLLPLETWCQVRNSLSHSQIHSQSRCRSLSRCLSWRRRQLRSTLHSASASARAVINFYGFSPLDEAEADSNHSAACTGTARVNSRTEIRNQFRCHLPLVVAARACKSHTDLQIR